MIEAVFENLSIKQQVFRTLDEVCKTGAILASNTSTLDVDTIAAVTRRPQDVVGLHFFSPANIMRLLEVVRGTATAPDVLATTLKIAKRIGKIPVVSGVCFGFIGNRMLEPYSREAHRLLLEGAIPAQIDTVLTGFGLAMGVIAMHDLAGIDVSFLVRESRREVIAHDPGYGFPAWRGGPMHYAEGLGLAHVLERIGHYREALGTYGAMWFQPAHLLERLVASGKTRVERI